MKEFIQTEVKAETAILVGLITKNQNERKTAEYLDELAFLAETAGAVAVKHKSLKHLANILAKLLCYVICGKIVFIDNVRHKFILNLGAVEQSGCISLVNSRHINSYF